MTIDEQIEQVRGKIRMTKPTRWKHLRDLKYHLRCLLAQKKEEE